MKRILAPILLLTLLFPSIALGETVKWSDLVITNGLYFKKFTNVPFNGKVTGEEQGLLKYGVKVGPWVEYDENGRVSSDVTYVNGKKGTRVSYKYMDEWFNALICIREFMVRKWRLLPQIFWYNFPTRRLTAIPQHLVGVFDCHIVLS